MNHLRRTLVAALAFAITRPLAALAAWNKEAFSAKTPGDALKGLGIATAAPSKDLQIEAPEIAENGAVVPLEISSADGSIQHAVICLAELGKLLRFRHKQGKKQRAKDEFNKGYNNSQFIRIDELAKNAKGCNLQ